MAVALRSDCSVLVCDGLGVISITPALCAQPTAAARAADPSQHPRLLKKVLCGGARIQAGDTQQGFYLLAKAGPVTTLTEMREHPRRKGACQTKDLLCTSEACHDFALFASTAAVLSDHGVHEVSRYNYGPPQKRLGPLVLHTPHGVGGTPQCLTWDPERDTLYTCSSTGDVAIWSLGHTQLHSAWACRVVHLAGVSPVQAAILPALGLLALLLANRHDLLIMNDQGESELLQPLTEEDTVEEKKEDKPMLGFCATTRLPGPDEDARSRRRQGLGSLCSRGQPKADLTNKDTLRLFLVRGSNCQLRSYRKPMFQRSRQQVAPLTLGSDLGAALAGGAFSDVTVQCSDGVSVPAHRLIIATRIPYFSALLSERWQPHALLQPASSPSPCPVAAAAAAPATLLSKVLSTDAASSAVQSLFGWAYTGFLPDLDADTVVAVATLADAWCADAVKALCSDWLIHNLTNATMIESLQLGDMLSMGELRTTALEYVVAAWSSLSREVQAAAMLSLETALALQREVAAATDARVAAMTVEASAVAAAAAAAAAATAATEARLRQRRDLWSVIDADVLPDQF